MQGEASSVIRASSNATFPVNGEGQVTALKKKPSPIVGKVDSRASGKTDEAVPQSISITPGYCAMTSSALLTHVVAACGSVWKGCPSTRMDTFFTPGN